MDTIADMFVFAIPESVQIHFQTESTQVGKVGWESHSFPGNLPPRKRLSRQLHSAICLHLSCPAQGNNQDSKLSRLPPPGCHLCRPGKPSEVVPMHCNDSLPAGRVLLSARRRSCLSLHFCCCVFSEIIFKNGGRGAAPFSKGEHKILDKWAKVQEFPGSVWSP